MSHGKIACQKCKGIMRTCTCGLCWENLNLEIAEKGFCDACYPPPHPEDLISLAEKYGTTPDALRTLHRYEHL